MRKLLLLMTACLMATTYAVAQGSVGIKTDLLYGAVTFTPNLGLEIGLGKRTSIELSGSYNPWNLDGLKNDNKKLLHWMARVEFRYFLCERFSGHYFGIHALAGQYNIAGHELPLLFGRGSKDFRFEGSALGAGVSYGYQLVIGKHWNIDFNVGVGYANLRYGKYNCPRCGDKLGTYSRNYLGPTNVGISLIYIIK